MPSASSACGSAFCVCDLKASALLSPELRFSYAKYGREGDPGTTRLDCSEVTWGGVSRPETGSIEHLSMTVDAFCDY